MRILFAAIALAPFATPAMAQEEKPFEGVSVTAIAGADAASVGDFKANFMFGGQVGYDWQSKSMVFGVEGEVTGRTRSGCFSYAPLNYRSCDHGGRDIYLGGRIGTVLGGSTLLYAKAGYTNRGDTFDYSYGTTAVTIARDRFDGYRVGAGVEHRLTGGVTLKAEYRYSRYDGSFGRHQAVAGLGFRF